MTSWRVLFVLLGLVLPFARSPTALASDPPVKPTEDGSGFIWAKVRSPLKSTSSPARCGLRLAICGSRGRGGIEVTVNGKNAGNTGPLPDTGVMHRDGIRGYWFERDVPFDAALLKSGANALQLAVPARAWVDGVLYDYLRLELDEQATP